MVKNLYANAGDMGSISGLGRSPGEGSGNPFQYSSLGNPMDRGAWRAIIYGVTESDMFQQAQKPCLSGQMTELLSASVSSSVKWV